MFLVSFRGNRYFPRHANFSLVYTCLCKFIWVSWLSVIYNENYFHKGENPVMSLQMSNFTRGDVLVDKWFWKGKIKVYAARQSASLSLNCFLLCEVWTWPYASVIHHSNLSSFLTLDFEEDCVSDMPYKLAQIAAILHWCININCFHDRCTSIRVFFFTREHRKRYFFLKKLYIHI